MTTTSAKLRGIWSKIHSYTPPRHARDFGAYEELRALTEREWATVRGAIAKDGYIATIETHRWGFSFALVVYEPHVPIYPGVPAEPCPVILVSAYQIPGNKPRGNAGDQKLSPSAERPGGVFEVFEAITSTPENLAACAREGIAPPRHRGYYQY